MSDVSVPDGGAGAYDGRMPIGPDGRMREASAPTPADAAAAPSAQLAPVAVRAAALPDATEDA